MWFPPMDNPPEVVAPQALAQRPSDEEIQRVARWECSTHGHSITEILAVGRLAPQRVFCIRCGASWAVATPDLDWGE